jgi:bis(5'-nucleosyl)-tetraphosphatase (symmetrical)
MADYAIGDVQGCYDALMRLLSHIDFNERVDRLWFVGDLVNRGPESLAVLRFIHALPIQPKITLGNHDFHLLRAPDGIELGHWLRQQPLLCYSSKLQVVMCHAGICPLWDLTQAMQFAKELETVLSGAHYSTFLSQMYGNEPNMWSDDLTGIERLRVITNYFTRMRLCDERGALALNYKGKPEDAPKHLYPWYKVPYRREIEVDIVFGHWAALMGRNPHPKLHAIDSGCLWGGQLTALRLQDKKRFSVQGV